MVLNVFAMGAFAALGTDAVIALDIKTDKAVYAAGEEVIVTFGTKTDAAVGKISIGSQIAVSYDKDAIVPYSESADITAHGFTPAAAYSAATAYDTGLSQVIFNDTLIGNGQATISDADTANGWDSVVAYCVSDGSAAVYQDATAGIELFSIKMKIPADAADGTKIYVGVPATSVDMDGACELAFYNGTTGNAYEGNTDYDFSGFVYNYNIDAALVELTVGAAAPAEKEVKHADTMAQWADKAAGKINVGLVGKFSTNDIAIDYEGNKLTNVAKVGAKITINGTEGEGYTDYVYDVNGDGSELWFRAVVTGVDYNATGAAGDISVVYVVEMTDGTTYESIAYTTTVAEVYAEACGNGMPAFGA